MNDYQKKYGHLFEGLHKTMRFHHPKMINGLVDLCRFIPEDATGVEIGSFAGESSLILADHLKEGTLICVDPWMPDYYSRKQIPAAERVFDQVAEGFLNIRKEKRMSHDFLQEMIDTETRFDFVYIDGNHKYDYVRRDIKMALQVIKPGGMICGHDYKFKGSPGVERAVKELLQYPDVRFPDYSWLKFVDRVER